MTQADLIVVGAGAAGLMAAGQAASAGMRVALVDRNARAGRKIMITGKGRCNVTNNCGFERLISAVVRNSRFYTARFVRFLRRTPWRFSSPAESL
jgi:predicted flavoprotein YhiN